MSRKGYLPTIRGRGIPAPVPWPRRLLACVLLDQCCAATSRSGSAKIRGVNRLSCTDRSISHIGRDNTRRSDARSCKLETHAQVFAHAKTSRRAPPAAIALNWGRSISVSVGGPHQDRRRNTVPAAKPWCYGRFLPFRWISMGCGNAVPARRVKPRT